MSELKNLTESFNSRLEQAEERISELEDRSTEAIQSDEQKKNNKKQ